MADKIVTIATFNTLVEASIAKDQLEDDGIQAVLADTAAVGVAWHLTSAIGGIKLQVMDKDAERAISTLEDPGAKLSEVEELSSGEEAEDLEPEIDETNKDEHESPIDEIVDRALRQISVSRFDFSAASVLLGLAFAGYCQGL